MLASGRGHPFHFQNHAISCFCPSLALASRHQDKIGSDQPPACAATCPQVEPTCGDLKKYISPGGCAATCDAALKGEAMADMCGGPGKHGGNHSSGHEGSPQGPPPCAATCPAVEPTCADLMKYITPGGCAGTCGKGLKQAVKQHCGATGGGKLLQALLTEYLDPACALCLCVCTDVQNSKLSEKHGLSKLYLL